MLSKAKFTQLQQLFFCKVSSGCNISTITINNISVASENSFTKFTGDGVRVVTSSYSLNCFYKRNISDKDREKMGVDQSVTTVVYVSPLELQKKTGSQLFPDNLTKSYAGVLVTFLDEICEIESIIQLEPMFDGKTWVCLAYQINLKKSDLRSLPKTIEP